MPVDRIWTEQRAKAAGSKPVLAFAIHAGHQLREDMVERMALGDAERLREEDPYTDVWTELEVTRVVGIMSRFQVDLNRPRDRAVYRTPEDAWGLTVWKERLPAEAVASSLAEYDQFYASTEALLRSFEQRFGRFVVLDLHSYNHRRAGPDADPADPRGNPQVNVGTGTMDRSRWGAVVDRFMGDLRAFDFPGGALQVAENVKFRGGQFPKWVHETFPQSGCCLAVEVKKFFMDEWTGECDVEVHEAVKQAIAATLPGLVEALDKP